MRRRALGRRVVLAGVAATVAGCLGDGGDSDGDDDGDGGSTEGLVADSNLALGEVTESGDLALSSPAFEDGGDIPRRFGYDHDNVNPPLSIGGVPEGADSLALVVDDPDAADAAGEVWEHWLVWNVPPGTAEIPEGWDPAAAEEGTNDFGEVGYGGPAPPDGEHRYRFKLFALGTTLELPTDTDAAAMGEAMRGEVVAATRLDGTYPP